MSAGFHKKKTDIQTDRQTERQTDGRTDGQTKRRCDISTVVITIHIGPTCRKQPRGRLIIFTKGNERRLTQIFECLKEMITRLVKLN